LGTVDKSAYGDGSESVREALVWPPPVSDSDILWLNDPDTPAPSVPAAVSPEAPRPFVPSSHLLSADVAYEWHDAVALVQQLAEQLIPDKTRLPPGSIPPIEGIALGSTGRLRAQLDPTGTEPLVTGLGQALHRLLQDKPGPANLRLIAWQAVSGQATQVTLEELLRQLAGWERPGRLEKLAKLYERAIAVAPVQAAAVPAQLKVDAPSPVQERKPKPSISRNRLLQIAGAAGLTVAACVTAVVLLRPTTQAATSESSAATTESSGSPQSSPATSPLNPEEPSAATLLPDIQLPATTAAGRARQRANAARQARGKSLLSGKRLGPEMVTTSGSVSGEDSGAAAPGAGPIYTTDDHSVTEPVLVRPYLPLQRRPGVTEDKLGVLELLVDTSGHVESVHLRSPRNRYREGWWVFASKSWQFKPALKDGKPVRFLVRIALTDLNLADPQ